MTLAQLVEDAIRSDGRYPLEAYQYLHAGLEVAARVVHGERCGSEPRHVSGQQLSAALLQLAIQKWGRLARTVLARWNIHATRDFGEMVYVLIGLGVLGRQESDRIEDFDDAISFDDVFGAYEISVSQLDA